MARRRLTREFSIDLGGEEEPVRTAMSTNTHGRFIPSEKNAGIAGDDDRGKPQSRGLMQALRGRIRKLKLGDSSGNVAKLDLSDEQVKIEIRHEMGSHEESIEENEEDILLDVSRRDIMSIESEYTNGGDTSKQNSNITLKESNAVATTKEEEPRHKIGFRRRIMQCRLFRSFSIESKTTNFTSICDNVKDNKDSRRNSTALFQSTRRFESGRGTTGGEQRRRSVGPSCLDDPNLNVPSSWIDAHICQKQQSTKVNGKKPKAKLVKTMSLTDNPSSMPLCTAPAESDCSYCKICSPDVEKSAQSEAQKVAKTRKIQVAPTVRSTYKQGEDSRTNAETIPCPKLEEVRGPCDIPRSAEIPIRRGESLTEGFANSPKTMIGKILPPLRSHRSVDVVDSLNINIPVCKEKRKHDSLIDEYSLFKASPPTKFPEVRPRSKTMPCRPDLLASSSPKLDSKPPIARSSQNSLKDSSHLSPQTSPGISPRSPREPMKAKPLPIELPDKDNIGKFSRHSLIFPFSDSSSVESNDGGRSPNVTKSCLKTSNERLNNEQKTTKKVSWSPDVNRRRPALFRTYSLDNSNPTTLSHTLRKVSSSTAGSADRMSSPRRLLTEKQRVAAFEDCYASQH
ncbi:neurofilament heavy polypeptide-like [Ptychodera flava]|uniref:neurofilament heavy polypeptide-like n=1 Tax=Ptychodera flava TaxID=63121 RepID=UPI00396A91DC